MKRKIKKFSSIVLLGGIVLTFYNIYNFFVDDYSMTQEEYAREAMRIVYDSSPSAQVQKCKAK